MVGGHFALSDLVSDLFLFIFYRYLETGKKKKKALFFTIFLKMLSERQKCYGHISCLTANHIVIKDWEYLSKQ